MADHKKLIALFREKEGGLSRKTTDRASEHPSPCRYKDKDGQWKKGWHTNKGVTYLTFKSNGSKLGYSVNCKNFFYMPDEIWIKIYKHLYWDTWDNDNIESQAIADTLVWWSWGSGNGGATRSAQKFLAKQGITAPTQKDVAKELDGLVKKMGEKRLFDKLILHRREFYDNTGQQANIPGWNNALNKFVAYGADHMESVLKNMSMAMKVGLTVTVIAGLGYAYYLTTKKS
ncbi:MAG: hypothetical protein COA79_20335 [Planctomycetota bacterium]|nr:MAG: hypothetical protein COA79_20335 [Planctomycetota bacterium]